VATELKQVVMRSRAAWRRWLGTHHATSPGVWLVFHKVHTGTRGVSYAEALDEALCVGWIDSLVRRLDEDRYVRKFTPRKPRSVWSDINRGKWKQLKAAGRLTPAGLAAAPTSARYDRPPPDLDQVPAYIVTALKRRPAAWRFFQSLPPGQRRHYALWIDTARRAETRERRLAEALSLLEGKQRLGLK
jgi:uncharacterized protein YdeI (YjbR/CyaY-like superfamily)